MTTKILIIRFSSIGDILLTTPVVRCLKEQIYGESEIHYLVKKDFSLLLENNPYIDVIHEFDDNLNAVTEGLVKEGFHYIIDLHKNIRSQMVKRRLKGMHFTFNKLNVQKYILVNFGIDLLPDIHIVDRYFEAVRALGITNDQKGLDYFLPENASCDLEAVGLQKEKYLVLAIGGAHEGKKLPVERLSELCALIDKPIALIGGPEDAGAGERIAGGNVATVNLCGKTSIHESAIIIRDSALVISHDSGMMHVASAFGKKIISIWGATVPKFGMYPYLPHPDSIIIEADHLKFRPTSKLGNKNTKRERRTTEEIDLKKIAEAVRKLYPSGNNGQG